ncbi:MAG: hypothetical protein ACI8TX_001892 [Hyphomicrobiaceae bacterium]|jgi:hypothetical protein
MSESNSEQFDPILTLVSGVPDLHDGSLLRWYESEVPDEVEPDADFAAIVLAQHFANFTLWNFEDEARRTDVTDVYIADLKRQIDGRNQRRNDLVELLDVALLAAFEPHRGADAQQNGETAGMMIDRLSILSLKIWHMAINASRQDDKELAAECAGKLEVLHEQRADLATCVKQLLEDFAAGRRFFKLYRQFKAYNDERLNPSIYKNKPVER